MANRRSIINFGRNVRFQPGRFLTPSSEEELLAALQEHREGKIRVTGSRHAWSDAVVTQDLLIDMRGFDHVRIHEGRQRVSVGAGCQIKRLLAALNQHNLTIPSLGLISEQIANLMYQGEE